MVVGHVFVPTLKRYFLHLVCESEKTLGGTRGKSSRRNFRNFNNYWIDPSLFFHDHLLIPVLKIFHKDTDLESLCQSHPLFIKNPAICWATASAWWTPLWYEMRWAGIVAIRWADLKRLEL